MLMGLYEVPRDWWLEACEQQAILDFHWRHPLEGHRRLTFMMLGADVAAGSQATVYRVLRQPGVMDRWNGKPSKKGTGFVPPLKPHDHWHVDVSYLNICGTLDEYLIRPQASNAAARISLPRNRRACGGVLPFATGEFCRLSLLWSSPMRCLAIVVVLFGLAGNLLAHERPLVEKYLHSGELARGEQALSLAMAKEPGNDALRFQLGALQVFRAVERLGQALHEYGLRPEQAWAPPLLRMPVPKNEHPTPITYPALRRVLQVFSGDLAAAEATLAKIEDDHVKLPLRLAEIRFDLDGDGKATDRFLDVLSRVMRGGLPFLKKNPEFLVVFDRGDVAWLRAYCHLLMAIVDLQLSVDGQQLFDRDAHYYFDTPERPKKADDAEGMDEFGNPIIKFREPARLRSFRLHVLEVCKLNRETWRYIRAERSDDHEWLPNPRQKGVLGLPVRDEMIDAWLGMIDEMEGLMKGEKVIGNELLWLFPGTRGKFNFRTFLDDPPEELSIHKLVTKGISEKYLQAEGDDVNIMAFLRVSNVFSNPLAVGYSAWFN